MKEVTFIKLTEEERKEEAQRRFALCLIFGLTFLGGIYFLHSVAQAFKLSFLIGIMFIITLSLDVLGVYIIFLIWKPKYLIKSKYIKRYKKK